MALANNRIGFATWTMGDTPLADYLPKLEKMGFAGIEIVGDSARLPAAEVRSHTEEHGLAVMSVIGMDDIDLAHPLHSMRQESIEKVRDLLEYCSELHCPRLVLREKTGRMRPIVGRTKEWSLLQYSLRVLMHSASHMGVELAFLPVNRYEGFLVNTAQDALNLVDSLQVDIALNSYHMNLEENGLRSTLENVGRRLGIFYAAESHRRSLGDGRIDWLELCLALDAVEYSGDIIVECQAAGADPMLPVGRAPDWPDEVLNWAEDSISYLRVALAASRD
jgi:D-psicose/D-tagatose/L-ribulose 3-epimerase